ncbi:hypothetical protein QQ008_18225 [Fulvivirgaceae bacterium BMA10]|uniref:Antitoxin component YwqK of the YwqJK toxin-antitoxin module n=1 Tax=Splendidivirga corallicola TaxID=3051826 RepID=A0ABT8KRG6_9BACT|nr:hypothetical protein [Fulvivirgaceae bacterium BMA10]
MFRINSISLIFIFVLATCSYVFGQENETDAISLSEEQLGKPLTVDFSESNEEEGDKKKEKKRKKKVFYGIKTKKMAIRTGIGEKATWEIFHYLRDYEDPDPYVRDIYWYDFDDKKIKRTRNVNKRNGILLHGTYEKIRNEKVIEEGIYFKGTKHGRWVKYDKNNILLDKKKYFKGWPKESLVKYYDKDQTKIKEIVPIEYGKKEGNYFLFHDNGAVAVTGEYQSGERVKVWQEFYKFRRKKKREVQFKPDAYTDDFNTHILREWNEKGDLLYDKKAFENSLK